MQAGQPGPTRRALLAGAGVGLVGTLLGCDITGAGDRPTGSAAPTPRQPAHPDEALRARLLAAERDLFTRYADALVTHPELAAWLVPLRAHHAQHAAVLGGPVPSGAGTESGTPQASPGDPSAAAETPSVRRSGRPTDPAEVLAELASVETATAVTAASAAVRASAELASVLGALAAGHRQHALVLGSPAASR